METEKFTIVYISVVHPLFDHRFLYKQCKGLADEGFKVVYLNAKAEENETIENVEIVPIKGSSSRLKRFLLTFLLLPKLIRLKCDAIHLVDPELLPIGLLTKLFTRKIVVFDAHEDYISFMGQKYYLKGFIGKIIRVGMKSILKLSSALLDGFVFADLPTAELFNLPQNRKCLFFNFPAKSMFPEVPKDWTQRKFDMVLVGSMSKTSGTFVLLESVKILKEKYRDIKLLLIGKPDENIEDDVLAFIKDNDLENNITITGRIPHSKVPELLQDCKIGCITLLDLPKFRKNIATKMFEYLASGIPVVSSDLPPEREYIIEGKTGLFFTPGNADELAKQIDRILSDVSFGKQLSENARKYMIENNLFAENEMKKLADFYRYLFEHPRRLFG